MSNSRATSPCTSCSPDGRISALKLGNPSGNISLQCAGQEVAAFKREIKIAQAYKFAVPVAMPTAVPEAVPAASEPIASPF